MIDSPPPHQQQRTEVRRRSSSHSEQPPLAISYEPSIGKLLFFFLFIKKVCNYSKL